MHNLPVFGLGLSLALAGLALFAVTLRKSASTLAPANKTQEREKQARQTESNKMRLGAAILVVAGAVLMIFS